MTALDITKVYLSPNERNPITQDSVVRQILENIQHNQYLTVLPSGDTSGATDYNNITQTIALAASRGISYVVLGAGTFYINNTITISQDDIKLIGAGCGGNEQTLIAVQGNFPGIKVSRAGAQVNGWGIGFLIVQIFSGSSNVGVQIDSALNGRLDNVAVTNSAAGSVSLLLQTDQSATCNNGLFNNFNTFLSTGATNAIGLKLTTSIASQDPFANSFSDVSIQLNNSTQTGIYLGGCDTNYFYNTEIYGGGSIAPTAIKFDYTNPATASWPGANVFFGIDCGFNITSGTSAFVNVGTPNQDTFPNVIHGFQFGNGAAPNYPLLGTETVVPYRPWDKTQPTATALSGAITTANTNLFTKVLGRTVIFRCQIDVSNIGSASQGFSVPLPYSPPNWAHACDAFDKTSPTNTLAAVVSTANNLQIWTASGNTTNHSYMAAGVYEMSSSSTST